MSARFWLGSAVACMVAVALAQAPPQVGFEGEVTRTVTGVAELSFRTTLPDGYHVNSDAPLEEFLRPTRLQLVTPDGIRVGEVRYPEAHMFKTRFSEQPLAVYEQRFEIGVTLELADLDAGEYPIDATLKYQACSERICYPPAKRKTRVVLDLSDN